MSPPEDVVARLAAIPAGTGRGKAFGKPYVVTRSRFNNGKSDKLVAEELGGTDYISLNLYHLNAGTQLFPCEMSAQKVISFLRAYVPSSESPT